MKQQIYIGNSPLKTIAQEVTGKWVRWQNESFYKIANYNNMPHFFMSIVSDSDHWMFLSSNGALSAGRKNRDHALFPYYTVDKIHDYEGITGATSVMLVKKDDRTYLWEPFSKHQSKLYRQEYFLYKSIYGNKVIFEAINHDLNLKYRYGWSSSEKFGFVKDSEVENIGNVNMEVDVLDGIKNILPSGVDYAFQNEYSNLLDGYKKNELLEDTNVGLFMLSSIPVDRAEPSESLRATTVWSFGVECENILLSEQQIERFKAGEEVATEKDVRASRGAYLLNTQLVLEPQRAKEWFITADIDQDMADVTHLLHTIRNEKDIRKLLKNDIDAGTKRLKQKVSGADGLQLGNDEIATARHFSNTLFNIMRGGIFNENYCLDRADFELFLLQRNKTLAKKVKNDLQSLNEKLSYFELNEWANSVGDADLIRLATEYLPLTFSRRHGDPSRPWNLFSIDTKNEDGSAKLNYQGNWRDIFQNWEALALSYPHYIWSMISQFLNASTADGFNPYRIMRDGIDWECPDPDDPWAYIGYWGDHQIIYLQKFLEQADMYFPGELDTLFEKSHFVYANVPYRIKPYDQMVANSFETVTFDHDLNRKIEENTALLGGDAKLLSNAEGKLHRVNMSEKILVTLLAKLSNFIPDAGIWLNTQRPEWNDANNALVGNGASMVTLYYLRRFLTFWKKQLDRMSLQSMEISVEVFEHFKAIEQAFCKFDFALSKGFSDKERKQITDDLGEAFCHYRWRIYENSFTGKKAKLLVNEFCAFIDLSLRFVDASIENNRRTDGLFHAYNLVSFTSEQINIRYLYPMLEGQVAVLSAGYLQPDETVKLLDELRNSDLYRADQWSYLLYPNRELARFIQKNNIPKEKVVKSELLTKLISENIFSVIQQDVNGDYHFNADLRNAQTLNAVLKNLDKKWDELIAKEKEYIFSIYEELFDHKSFTGRSGTFYAYEGLGSIYWHMVSKLLLAIQENFFIADELQATDTIKEKLAAHYADVKKGIGMHKSPEHYGAFPIDAYSHTPGNAGVKQPGMTGQVKEDVITRLREVGIRIANGEIHFDVPLFDIRELLKSQTEWHFYNVLGDEQTQNLNENEFGFTYCCVPIVYKLSANNHISVYMENEKTEELDGLSLNRSLSELVFSRSGKIEKILVHINV